MVVVDSGGNGGADFCDDKLEIEEAILLNTLLAITRRRWSR